jgi:hypothetical protein
LATPASCIPNKERRRCDGYKRERNASSVSWAHRALSGHFREALINLFSSFLPNRSSINYLILKNAFHLPHRTAHDSRHRLPCPSHPVCCPPLSFIIVYPSQQSTNPVSAASQNASDDTIQACEEAPNCEVHSTEHGLKIRFKEGMGRGAEHYRRNNGGTSNTGKFVHEYPAHTSVSNSPPDPARAFWGCPADLIGQAVRLSS